MNEKISQQNIRNKRVKPSLFFFFLIIFCSIFFFYQTKNVWTKKIFFFFLLKTLLFKRKNYTTIHTYEDGAYDEKSIYNDNLCDSSKISMETNYKSNPSTTVIRFELNMSTMAILSSYYWSYHVKYSYFLSVFLYFPYLYLMFDRNCYK